MITALILQMCLYFSGLYLGLFFVVQFAIQVYKWITLPYSSGALASELTLLLLLVAVDALRIQLGKRGNLTDKKAPLVASVFLLAPSVLAVLYSMLWQNYVLRLEVVICGIQLGIQAITLVIFVVKIIAVLTQPIAL